MFFPDPDNDIPAATYTHCTQCGRVLTGWRYNSIMRTCGRKKCEEKEDAKWRELAKRARIAGRNWARLTRNPKMLAKFLEGTDGTGKAT